MLNFYLLYYIKKLLYRKDTKSSFFKACIKKFLKNKNNFAYLRLLIKKLSTNNCILNNSDKL